MHDLGASSLSLSLMATAASAPFFLFTLPAGAVADIVNRRFVIVSAVMWQGACAALLALGAWTRVINPNSVLACIFVLGIGLAFSAPVWGAIVPDIVSKDELLLRDHAGRSAIERLHNRWSLSRRFRAAAAWRTAAHFS